VGGEMLCQPGRRDVLAVALPGFHCLPGEEAFLSLQASPLPHEREGERRDQKGPCLLTAPNCPAHVCSRQTMRKSLFAPTVTLPLI